MQELLKQTEADLAEINKLISRLKKQKRATTSTSKKHEICRKLSEAELMYLDLVSYKTEIERYLNARGDNND